MLIFLIFLVSFINSEVTSDTAQSVLDKYLNSISSKDQTGLLAVLSEDFKLTKCDGKELHREEVAEKVRITNKVGINNREALAEIQGTDDDFSFRLDVNGVCKTTFTVMNGLITSEKQMDCQVPPILTAVINDSFVAMEYAQQVIRSYVLGVKSKQIAKVLNSLDANFARNHCNGNVGTKANTQSRLTFGTDAENKIIQDPKLIEAKYVKNGEEIECRAELSASTGWKSTNIYKIKLVKIGDPVVEVPRIYEETEGTCDGSPFKINNELQRGMKNAGNRNPN